VRIEIRFNSPAAALAVAGRLKEKLSRDSGHS
jgi:hypothetical protein